MNGLVCSHCSSSIFACEYFLRLFWCKMNAHRHRHNHSSKSNSKIETSVYRCHCCTPEGIPEKTQENGETCFAVTRSLESNQDTQTQQTYTIVYHMYHHMQHPSQTLLEFLRCNPMMHSDDCPPSSQTPFIIFNENKSVREI